MVVFGGVGGLSDLFSVTGIFAMVVFEGVGELSDLFSVTGVFTMVVFEGVGGLSNLLPVIRYVARMLLTLLFSHMTLE